MNIIWQKPDSTLAVTFLCEGPSSPTYANNLKTQGAIPPEWQAMAFDVADLPTEPQELWRWVDGKAQPVVVPDPKIAILAQIAALETEQLMPRATREFMLLFMQSSFTPAQLAANPGYAAVKAFDGQITALRSQL